MTRKMKDSGIEWIGEIPEEWEIKKIKYLYSIIDDRNINDENARLLSLFTALGVKPRNEMADKGNKAITVINYKKVKINDLIVNKLLAWMGSIGYSDYEGVTSPDYDVYRAISEDYVDRDYYNAYFRFTNFKDDCYKYGRGIMMMRWRTYPEQFKNIFVINPPLKEQKKIAGYIDTKCSKIDETIQKEKQVIEKLKQYKQSVITEAVTKGLDSDVKMKDSGVEWIGEIPEHWNVCRIKNISQKITDGAHVSPDTDNGIYDFISVVNYSNGTIDFKDCLKTSEESYKLMVNSGCKPELYDVLISKDGTVGKSLVVDFDKEFVVASSFVIIRPNKNINPYFLNYLLKSNFVQEQLSNYMKGTGLKRVSVTNNGKLIIVITDIKEQKEIATFLDKKCASIDKAILNKEKLIEKLTEYKKSLIYECVTGKREV